MIGKEKLHTPLRERGYALDQETRFSSVKTKTAAKRFAAAATIFGLLAHIGGLF
jgi:hypothetical protein